MEALMATDRQRVVIIGAGHNGLIAAFYLARADMRRSCWRGPELLAVAPSLKEIARVCAVPTILDIHRSAAAADRKRSSTGKTRVGDDRFENSTADAAP